MTCLEAGGRRTRERRSHIFISEKGRRAGAEAKRHTFSHTAWTDLRRDARKKQGVGKIFFLSSVRQRGRFKDGWNGGRKRPFYRLHSHAERIR